MTTRKFMAATAVIVAIACAGSAACQAQDLLKPDETFLFAERDSINLYMDVYYPADGSEMTVDGVNKPTILYVFGGGFKVGRKDTPTAREWFRLLTDEGFTVAAIDYRLGLKGVEGMGSINDVYNAIQIAVEDLFSATKYILDNAEEVDIDPSSLVIAGSSAGAITVLQAEWELCNRMGSSVMLPKGFHYAGVMSFAGAIYSRQGTVRYHSEPAPHLLFHGTADRIVTYRQIHLLNHAFQGTKVLARIFKRNGYDYCVYRYDGNSHEIAACMYKTFPEQLAWLETNIIGKEKRTIDATVNDPSIEVFQVNDLRTLYSGKVIVDLE
ncbi:MAG: alpha/beta hydrolase [Bacteroidales bacterium]|nr:alpha/beta hydrolase [Bacteroidales bacterium]